MTWDHADSSPIADIRAWAEKMYSTVGVFPDVLMLNAREGTAYRFYLHATHISIDWATNLFPRTTKLKRWYLHKRQVLRWWWLDRHTEKEWA